jgi:ankyrin repeat protein
LIKNGADIDKAMLENGRTLLMDSALRGNSVMFDFLLDRGADRNLKCETGRTVAEYVKLEYIGKSDFTISEMGQMLYKKRERNLAHDY